MSYKKKLQLRTCLSVGLLLSAFLTSACSNESAQPRKPDATQSINSTSTDRQQTINKEGSEFLSKKAPENKLITLARKITTDYKLTDMKSECLTFELLQAPFEDKRIIDVRELHSKNCGGDINTSPRLFSIGVNEATGEVWSDAKSLLGQLEKLD